MRRVLLTGMHGAVAYAMKKELDDKYEVSGLSVARMDDVLRDFRASAWKEQLDTFRDKLMDQLTTAFRGKDAVAHLGWNTQDENHKGGLDPLNIMVVDCCYQAAIAEKVPRLYMASSVHAYDFKSDFREDVEPVKPFPDVRNDPFGHPPTSLYGVSKR